MIPTINKLFQKIEERTVPSLLFELVLPWYQNQANILQDNYRPEFIISIDTKIFNTVLANWMPSKVRENDNISWIFRLYPGNVKVGLTLESHSISFALLLG